MATDPRFFACSDVVLLDEDLLRSARAMWELGAMMADSSANGQTQSESQRLQAALTVVPVLLMEPAAVAAIYEQHWTPALVEAARSKGLPPATLADLQHLLALEASCRVRAGTETRYRPS